MKASGVALLLAFCSFCQHTLGGDSILQVGDNCGRRAALYKGVSISEADEKVVRSYKVRSALECLQMCSERFPTCTASYHNEEGMCMEIQGINGSTYQSAGIAAKGTLMDLAKKRANDDCGVNYCSDDEICLQGCQFEDFTSPVCVRTENNDCDFKPQFMNIRHYWSARKDDGSDSGTVMFVTYPKSKEATGIRVMMSICLRAHYNHAGGCNMWYLTFNQDRCTNPESVAVQDYSADTGDLHFASSIDETCYGLDAGDVRIDLVISECDSMSSSDGYSGWNSARSMTIMEVNTNQDYKPCSSAVSFGFHDESWNEVIDESADFTQTPYLVKSITYEKLADDTKLRIKYTAYTGIHVLSDATSYCGRWYIVINGRECSPKVDYIIQSSSTTYWENHMRTRILEGICQDSLTSGTYSIEIYMGACSDHFSPAIHSRLMTGNSYVPSRITIEEVRPNTSVDSVLSNNGQLYRSFIGNLQYWSWHSLNNDDDDATILTVDFTKEYEDTALRLTSSGDHRHKHANGVCTRWHFEVDDAECSDPGSIEGVVHFHPATNAHMPMQVSGICHGVSRGYHTIQYKVGACQGVALADGQTGHDSSFHIFAEEMRVELNHVCVSSSIPVDCGP